MKTAGEWSEELCRRPHRSDEVYTSVTAAELAEIQRDALAHAAREVLELRGSVHDLASAKQEHLGTDAVSGLGMAENLERLATRLESAVPPPVADQTDGVHP